MVYIILVLVLDKVTEYFDNIIIVWTYGMDLTDEEMLEPYLYRLFNLEHS